MFDPNYKSPRSVQMNIGVQREIRHGMVLSADYVRNVQTHFLLGIDHNHTGDIRYFNRGAAQQAIAVTNNEFGCGSGFDTASINCAIAAGASMADYAGNGLTSSTDFGGSSCFSGTSPSVDPNNTLFPTGYGCAFGGINPLAPPLGFLTPVGRSVYNGLQTKLTTNVVDPLRGVHVLNLQIAYALSRFDNSGGGVNPDATVTASSGDQDFIVPALDQQNVNRYFGPSTLDRTHQISFGGYMTLKGGLQLGLASHFYSPLSTTLTVPNTTAGGEIFRTDFTGDGTTQDPIPGTNIGAFGRSINAGNINSVLSKYNSTVAGTPTPAGQTLVSDGLMTTSQLVSLGAVAPTVSLAPTNQVNLSWLRAFDMTVGWTYKFKERLTFRPQVGFYNLFNFANFDAPTSMLSGLLNGSSGSINGTTPPDHFVNRVGVGTGVFALGSPRQMEFALKIDF